MNEGHGHSEDQHCESQHRETWGGGPGRGRATRALRLLLASAVLLALVAVPTRAQDVEQDSERERHVFITDEGQRVELEDDHRFVVVRTDEVGNAVGEGSGEVELENTFFVSGSPRGFLGVQLVELTPELREHYGVAADTGVLVGKVVAGSPAEEAGLRVGDVLTGLDGEAMGSSVEVRRHIGAIEDGEVVALEVYRDGQRLERTARIVEKERPQVDVRRFLDREGREGVWSYRVDPEQMGEALEELQVRITDPEFKESLMHFSSREEQLEQRIEELEKRLEELARTLEEK